MDNHSKLLNIIQTIKRIGCKYETTDYSKEPFGKQTIYSLIIDGLNAELSNRNSTTTLESKIKNSNAYNYCEVDTATNSIMHTSFHDPDNRHGHSIALEDFLEDFRPLTELKINDLNLMTLKNKFDSFLYQLTNEPGQIEYNSKIKRNIIKILKENRNEIPFKFNMQTIINKNSITVNEIIKILESSIYFIEIKKAFSESLILNTKLKYAGKYLNLSFDIL